MNKSTTLIKSKSEEIKWFTDLVNLDLNLGSSGASVNSHPELEIHLRKFFARKTPKSAKMGFQEILLLEQLSSGEILIEDIFKLRQKIGSIIRSIMLDLQLNFILEGTKWTPIDKWVHKTNIYEHEISALQLVEIAGLEYEKRKTASKGNVLIRWAPNRNKERLVTVKTTPTNFSDYLFTRFLEAIDQIPCSAFRQCPECGSCFVHLSKKRKINCSNKCSARKVSRERREKMKVETPQKYKRVLKEGANRARKSYEKKVPHGKPARRPYKYKEEE